MIEFDPTGKEEHKYHYTETVVIPHRYFLVSKGCIALIAEGYDVLATGEEKRIVYTVTKVYYVVHDDKIELLSNDQWYQDMILS